MLIFTFFRWVQILSIPDFENIVTLIRQSQLAATRAVNTVLVNLYWQVGGYISAQMANAAWGDKTIEELADIMPGIIRN